jgi:ABC-type nitrate/sulfonate/bicarbonate transport system substrate-binding protein
MAAGVMKAIMTAAAILTGAHAAAAQTALKVMVFPGLSNYSIFAAQHKDFFAKHGLAIDLVNAPNSDVQRQQLANGEIQIAETAADNIVAMAEIAKLDAILVSGDDSGYNHVFVQPEIGSYADLRGTTVAVDAPNTAFALLLYKTLKNAGLNKGDYQVKSVGGSGQRLDAMTKDKLAAAVLNPPFVFRAAQAGLKDMGSATAAVGAYQAVGTSVMRSWAQANADTLTNYIRALIEGGRWIRDPANKAEAISLLVDRLQLAPELAAKSYAIALDPANGMFKDATIDVEGFRNVLKLRAEIEGQWGGVAPTPEKYFDLSYHAKALAGL